MILSVNPNTCIDRTLLVPEFSLNKTIRASRMAIGMGGKAADASWILGEYGISSRVLGFAAGASGQQMELLLNERGVETDFTRVKGETRVNTVLVMEDGSGQSTFGASTLVIAPEDIADLEERFVSALPLATCVILGGTLPAGVSDRLYTRLVSLAGERQIPILLDASGACLLAGLEGRPSIIKPNRSELEELVRMPLSSAQDMVYAAKKIQDQYGCSVVITLGDEGSLAILPDRIYQIPVLPVKVVSTAGAGDGMLAGLAAALSTERSLEDGLRLGTAMAGAVCMQLGTADCRKPDIDHLLQQVKLIPVEV